MRWLEPPARHKPGIDQHQRRALRRSPAPGTTGNAVMRASGPLVALREASGRTQGTTMGVHAMSAPFRGTSMGGPAMSAQGLCRRLHYLQSALLEHVDLATG